MYVSMNPKGETGKVIHISQNDTNREVEFIPFDQKGLTPLTDGQLTARINSIKGNTVSFNQLFDSDTPIVITTSTTQAFKWANIIPNHKYYVFINGSFASSWQVYDSDTRTNVWATGSNNNKLAQGNYKSVIVQPTSYNYLVVRNVANTISVSSNVNWQPMLLDLTLMGIDNLTTTAEVEQWLSSHIGDLPYFDYTQGSLISFNGSGLKTVGFNQWDEEYELGKYDTSTGVKTSSSTNIRNKNVIKVLPNTAYYYKAPVIMSLFYYDGNGSFISMAYVQNEVKTTPSNCASIGFFLQATYGTTYNHDICINISDVNKNGTYEPYTSNTLSLPTQTYFPFGEDGIGTARDELIPNSDVYKRVGIVDMGNLDWAYESGDTRFRATMPSNYLKPTTSEERLNLKCGIYKPDWSPTSGTQLDMTITGYSNSSTIYVNNFSYTDATTFKNAMKGVQLCFLLETPLHNYGVVDMGTLDWGYSGTRQMFYYTLLDAPDSNDYLSSMYLNIGAKTDVEMQSAPNMTMGHSSASSGKLQIKIKNTSYTDAATFKNAMSGVYLLYQLTTPIAPSSMEDTYPVWQNGTEQILPVNGSTPDTASIKANITYPDRTEDTEFLYKQTSFVFTPRTWAFVCKNITQALTLVGNVLKGTIPSGMTSESGKFPLKVKMTDNDGVCFSEKIDLFVERKP